jgi:hypothetical protein
VANRAGERASEAFLQLSRCYDSEPRAYHRESDVMRRLSGQF